MTDADFWGPWIEANRGDEAPSFGVPVSPAIAAAFENLFRSDDFRSDADSGIASIFGIARVDGLPMLPPPGFERPEVDARDAAEADRLTSGCGHLPGLVERATDSPTLPHPLLGVTAEPTLLFADLDRVVDSMRRWRTYLVPGGFSLDIPPRSEPEGWWSDDRGIAWPRGREKISIRPFYETAFDRPSVPWQYRLYDDPRDRVYSRPWDGESVYEVIGIPRWLAEEQVRRASRRLAFAEQFENEPVCPSGHTTTGKPNEQHKMEKH